MFIYFDNTRNCMFKHTDRIGGKRWRLMDFDLGSDSDDLSKKSLKLDLYVHALEEEMNKIEAFKRELPNCMQLLKDAIERLKEERGREAMRNYEGDGRVKASNGITEKKNWMNSVQLYTPVSRNQDSVSHLTPRFVEGEGSGSRNDLGCRFRNQGGAFMPFKKATGAVKEEQGTAVADGLSIATVEAEVALKDQAKLEEPQQQEQQKKQRRCWSPELHKIFVEALHQLGGAQSATPKQIREIMKVDGLTNDEVKSHLQKYRIHIRRVDQARSSSGLEQFAVSGSPQGPLNGGKAAATGGDSIEDEEEGKSESNGWKSKFEKAL